MNMAIKIKNEGFTEIEKQINKECKKLEKYSLENPKIACKILNLKKGIHVKISLDSKKKHFSGEAQGMQTDICISKAVKRLIKIVDKDKKVILKRNNYDSFKGFNFNFFNRDEIDSNAILKSRNN